MNEKYASKSRLFVLIAVCTLSVVMALSAAAQTTRYVWPQSPWPGDPYTSWETAAHDIQSAVDACSGGETILVTDNYSYVLSSRITVGVGVTIRGVGANKPEINGNNSVGCFFLNNAYAVLDNLEIYSGNAANGGGVEIGAFGGTVQNCVINNNVAMDGGGVYIAAEGTVRNCRIYFNNADRGGGVQCNGEGTVENCNLYYNQGRDYGGGVDLGQHGTARNCVITNNSSTTGAGLHSGAGMSLARFATALNCVIRDNNALTAGGGVILFEGGQVVQCRIEDNHCGDAGGGVLLSNGGIVYGSTIRGNTTDNSGSQGGGVNIYTAGSVESCLIADNASLDRGGGVYILTGGTVKNCSVQDNTATYWGGGIDCDQGGTVLGCTIAGNTSDQAGGIHIWPGVTVQDSIIYDNNGTSGNPNYYRDGGGGDFSYCCLSPLFSGTGNIDVDPFFVNTAAGNYRLSLNSPCIDAATPGDPDSGEKDADLRARMANGRQDMGAYEYQASWAIDPAGWVYFQWPYAYPMNEAAWYYFNEPSTQWRVSLPGGVWQYMSQGGTATGWNYYQWPYCYSMAAAGWFWFYADASSPQWCVNLNSAQWSMFGQ